MTYQDYEPQRPRPPLIGTAPPAVKDRPRCPRCAKPLRPYLRNVWERVEEPNGEFHNQAVARQRDGTYSAYRQIFCGVNCAAEFAVSVVVGRCASYGSRTPPSSAIASTARSTATRGGSRYRPATSSWSRAPSLRSRGSADAD